MVGFLGDIYFNSAISQTFMSFLLLPISGENFIRHVTHLVFEQTPSDITITPKDKFIVRLKVLKIITRQVEFKQFM